MENDAGHRTRRVTRRVGVNERRRDFQAIAPAQRREQRPEKQRPRRYRWINEAKKGREMRKG